MPTITAWLQAAVATEERDGRADTRPVLEALAAAAAVLRAASWNADAAENGTASVAGARPDQQQ
jgi:hypothetical protein